MMKLKAIKTCNHDCSGCAGDTDIEDDCIETSYNAGVQGLPPCVRSREYQGIIYVEVVNVLCINTSCEYFKEECCPIDNTNCSIHCDSELLDGDCKRFEHE